MGRQSWEAGLGYQPGSEGKLSETTFLTVGTKEQRVKFNGTVYFGKNKNSRTFPPRMQHVCGVPCGTNGPISSCSFLLMLPPCGFQKSGRERSLLKNQHKYFQFSLSSLLLKNGIYLNANLVYSSILDLPPDFPRGAAEQGHACTVVRDLTVCPGDEERGRTATGSRTNALRGSLFVFVLPATHFTELFPNFPQLIPPTFYFLLHISLSPPHAPPQEDLTIREVTWRSSERVPMTSRIHSKVTTKYF